MLDHYSCNLIVVDCIQSYICALWQWNYITLHDSLRIVFTATSNSKHTIPSVRVELKPRYLERYLGVSFSCTDVFVF